MQNLSFHQSIELPKNYMSWLYIGPTQKEFSHISNTGLKQRIKLSLD